MLAGSIIALLASVIAFSLTTIALERARQARIAARAARRLSASMMTDRYKLEQENKQLRLQLGMSPQRRTLPVAPAPSVMPPKDFMQGRGYRFAQASTPPVTSFGGASFPLLMVGATALLLQLKKKKARSEKNDAQLRKSIKAYARLKARSRWVSRGKNRRALKALKQRLQLSADARTLLESGHGVSEDLRRSGIDALLEAVRDPEYEGQ